MKAKALLLKPCPPPPPGHFSAVAASQTAFLISSWLLVQLVAVASLAGIFLPCCCTMSQVPKLAMPLLHLLLLVSLHMVSGVDSGRQRPAAVCQAVVRGKPEEAGAMQDIKLDCSVHPKGKAAVVHSELQSTLHKHRAVHKPVLQ